MWPFVFIIIYQTFHICKQYLPKEFFAIGTLLLLLDPTIMAQLTLISPDVVLLMCLLYLLRSLSNFKFSWQNTLFISLLMLISLRGVMIALAYFICIVIFHFKRKSDFKSLCVKAIAFLPGALLFCIYMYVHFTTKGWIGFHGDSQWSPSFQMVDLMGVIKNIVILIWRLLDFGRLIWFVIVLIFIKNFKNIIFTERQKELTYFFVLTLFVLSINSIFYKGLLGHRYFIPPICIGSLLLLSLLYHSLFLHRTKKIFSIIIGISLILGNFLVYPTGISQGWDSSMAHFPYFKLRKEMYKFIEDNHIHINEIACSFPNLAKEEYLSLSDSDVAMQDVSKMIRPKYLLMSNIYNDMYQTQQFDLKYYVLIKELKKNRVFLQLYTLK
ncbi:MAG: hypothetical protein RLZZ546_409 [Bacteroidota bacterium]